MKSHRFIIVVLVFTFIRVSSGYCQQTAEQLYQSGLYKEEINGEMDAAIKIYETIINKYPENRSVAAKALLHFGICKERLGMKEAQTAYERVVREYADQSDIVTQAKTRLAALGGPAGSLKRELSVRQVWAGRDADLTGSPSIDGRFLSTTDWNTGDVAIRDMITGEMRHVTKTADVKQSTIFALNAIYSPDNQRIAYAWYDPKKFQGFDLWLTGADGTGAHILYHNETASVYPNAWTPDGKNIIATEFLSKEKVKQIVLVSASDGSTRLLKSSIPDRISTKISVSPDGLTLVYDMPQADGKRDIFLFSLPNGPETRLVENPADDGVPIWQPDGKAVLFMSDRTGSPALWAQKVTYGKTVALPELVKQDIGRSFIPMGFSRNGALYYGISTDISDVYVATIDLKTGRVIEPPTPISQQMVGTRYLASWSPDGKYLAYLRLRTPGTPGHTIIIRTFDGGEERSLHVDASTIRRLVWSPDGTALIFPGLDSERQPGVFRVNLRNGVVMSLVQAGPNVVIPQADITHDGKSLVYLTMNIVSGLQTVVVRDLQTGQEKVITKPSPIPTGMALSPDGLKVAVTTADEASGRHTVLVVPVAGGAEREIYGVDKPRTIVRFPAWTPDGRQILCPTTLQNKPEYFLVPVDGGEPQKMASPMNGITDFSFHPDGRHVAFSAGQSQNEVWMMENFLPKEKSESSNQLTLRKLDYDQLNTPFARLSPDGKKIAYVVYAGGSPKRFDMLDLNSGTTKVLLESSVGDPSSLVWSPQSDKIAYTFHGSELHVRDINGTNSQLLLKSPEYRFYPFDWSRNGKKILCFLEGDDRTVRIGTVTIDGQLQVLASGNRSEFISEPRFSPDGGFVACSLGERSGNTDIYVWTSDGSRKVQVTSHPGRDESPVWSPDGKYLVFLSDRNRSVDLWGVQMKDGETVGAPFIIKQDIGWRTEIKDFTASGKLFLFMLGGAEPANLFTIPVNQESENLSGTITPISVYPTAHSFPRYSPNGKMIAFLSRRGQISLPKLFVIDEKGAERELPLQDHFVTNFAWHPENRSVLFTGWDKAYKTGIFEISLDKNELKQIYSGETIDMKTSKGGLININLLPDAGKIMFFRLLEKGYVDVITCMPDGQKPVVVLPRMKMPTWGLPSPTGENICYRLGDSLMVVSISNGATKLIGSSTLNLEATWATHGENLMFREGSSLRIFSVKENTTRTLYQAPAGKIISGMEMYANTWSPNGNRVIITEQDPSVTSTSPQKLILINAVDGSINVLGEAPKGYRLKELRWSPDGSKIVATGNSISSVPAPSYEYWVMENFLPK